MGCGRNLEACVQVLLGWFEIAAMWLLRPLVSNPSRRAGSSSRVAGRHHWPSTRSAGFKGLGGRCVILQCVRRGRQPNEVLDDAPPGKHTRDRKDARAEQERVDARLRVNARGEDNVRIEGIRWSQVRHGTTTRSVSTPELSVNGRPRSRTLRPPRKQVPVADGFNERMVRLAERQGEMLAAIVVKASPTRRCRRFRRELQTDAI